MVDKAAAQLLDRFRVVATRVTRVEITDRFGIPQQTVYRYLKPDYYPARRLDPDAEARLRTCVDSLESEQGVYHDVPRETAGVAPAPTALARKAAAWDIVAGVAELVRGAGTEADLAPLVDDMLRKVREQFRPAAEERSDLGDQKAQ